MAYINGINIDDNLINQYKKVMGNSQTKETKTNKKTSVAPQGSNVNNVIADAMKQNGLQESTKDVREALGDVGEDITKRLSQTKIVKALSNTLNNVSDKNTDALNKTKDLTKGIGYEFANSTDGKVKGFGLANNNLQESKNWLKQYNNNKDFQDSLYYDFAVNQSNLYEDYKGAMKSLEKMDKDTKANYEYYLNESAKNNDLDTYKELIASINNKDNSVLEKLGRGVVSGIQEAVSSPMNVVSGAVGGLAEASTGRENLLTENVRNYQKELNLTKQGFQDENQVLNTLYNGVNGATKTLSLLALDPQHALTWQVGDSAVAKYNEYIDKGVDPNRAYAGLVMNMAMSYGVNKTGMDKLIARLGGGEIDATMDLAYQTLGSRILKGMGSQFLEEGGEGLVEYFLEQQLDNAIANTDVDYKLGDAMLSFVQEGFGGLITGGVTEFAGFNIRSINAQKQAMSDINYLNYLLVDNSIPKSKNDIKLINDRINKLEQAIDTYKGQSVLGQAVEFIDDKDATYNRYIADKQFKQDSLSANQELDTKNLAMEQAVAETELEDKFNQNNEDIAKVQATEEEIAKVQQEQENLNREQIKNDGISKVQITNANDYANFSNDFKESLKKIDKVASKFKTGVIVDSTKFADGDVRNAYYDGKTNTIVLNPNGKNHIVSAYIHELTHSFKGTKGWDKLVKLTNDYWKKNGGINDFYAKLENAYTKNNLDLDEDTKIEESVTYAIEESLGNEEFLNKLYADDRNLFQRIWNDVKTFAKTGDLNAIQIEKQFKKVFDANKNLENRTNENVKNSIDLDSDGNEVNPQMQEYMKDSKARDEDGNLVHLYHGSTANEPFYTFDRDKANVEGDWGKGFYLSNNYDDVSGNYEGGGQDYENKVSQIAERLMYDEDLDEEEAYAQAREQLGTGTYLIDAYANIKNPAYTQEQIDKLSMDYYAEEYDIDDFDNEDDYNAEVENLMAEAVEEWVYNVDNNIDISYDDHQKIVNALYEMIWNGGATPLELKDKINELYLEGDEGIIGNEVARLILEGIGYDGIIDNSVSQRFNRMNGMYDDTTHYIVFNENQIKDINNQNPTTNPDIRYSLDLDDSNNFDEEAKTNLSDFLDLPTDDLSTYFQSNAKSTDAQIESMKKRASKHPEKWIPNYAQIKNRFAGLSSQTIGRATFEIIIDGKISDETSRDLNKEFKDWIKKDIKDVEIKDSMYLDTEQFVNDFAEVCQEYFETNDLYESNKKQDSKIAKESLKYLRVGEESPIAYEDGKKYLERNAQSEVNREQLRQTSFEWLTDWFNSLHASQEGAKNQMRDLKKIKVGRNIDQVLKYMSNHNGKILDNLRNTFGKQWNDARTRQAEFKRVYGGLLQEIVNSGITEDSELSKYVQYIMEGHTEEILEVQGNDGNNVKERKKFTTKDLQKLVNDGKISQDDYQKVIDTAIKLRSAYDDIFDLINTQRRDIYGNLEEEVRNELIKQEVKVDEAYKVLKKLENELLSKPTEQLQAQFDQAKKQYNREYNVYEKLLDKNISKDDVRRQLLQYRQNYSHHIYKGNFIEDIKGISTPKNGVPTELVGLSDYTTPLSEFGTFFLKQNELGKYTPDAIASFNDYIKQASEIYGLDPYITFARTFDSELKRMAVGDDAHAFKNFSGWLTNHANLCAGKTDTDTRAIREWLGENNTKTLFKFLSKIRYNQLAYNNRTAVTQLLNIPNGIAAIENEGGSTKNFLNGFIQYQKDAKYSFGSKSNKGTLSSQSSFLTNRYWDVDTGKTGFKNFMSEVADTMMSMGDQIGTEFLWYSAYDLGKQKGYSGQELIDFADRLTENSVAGRGKGEVPLTMTSGFTKAFLPFQIETNNAWTQMRDELSDVFKGENAKVKATAMKSMTALLIFNYLMNGLTDWLFGDRVLFDPIDTLLEDEDADTKATHLVGEIISANPYGSVFLNALGLASDDTKKIFGDHSANRYGTGVAGLSQVGNIIKASGKDAKADALSKEIVKTTIPGGTQLVRTLEGGQSVGVIPYFEDGQLVYKTAELTSDGKVKFDNANVDSVDVIKALAFGKWATTEARAYIDSNFATIGAKKYDALKDVMSTKDMRELNSQFVSENKKDENGDSISNSKALNNRKVLEDNGLWNELSKKYTSKELSDIFGLNQTVADMSSQEFNAEYQKVWGDKENTKVVKEQNKSAIDFESFYKNFFSKKEDTKVENTKVEETKEETEEVKDYSTLNSDYDKNHKGELTNHYNAIAKDYDDEKKYILKQSSQFNAIYDDNGNTIKNSKALQVRNYLQENGMYEDVVNYIKENNLKASDFGLNNKVFAMSDETFKNAYSMLEQGKEYKTSGSSSSSSSTKKTAEQKAYETAMKKFKTYNLNQAKSYAKAMTSSSNTSSRLNMSVDDIRKEIEKLYK